jgi:putative thioredoxin
MTDASPTKWVIDVAEKDFEKEVLVRSKTVPVLVDFWAEWCEPCRQLGPVLEKLAGEKKGAFVLAKVNIDEAQRLAMYFRIESIPAVLAFKDGQAVNGFVGLLPEDQLTEFVNEIAPGVGGEEDIFTKFKKLEETDPPKAEEAYRQILAGDENSEPAKIGLARVLESLNKDEEAVRLLADLPEHGEIGAEVVKLRRTIEMKNAASTAGDETDLQKKVASEPQNAKLHYELGNVLATKGMYPEALQSLITAAELDNDLAKTDVRVLMVKIFEIIGVRSDLADEYRDKLRSLLY